MASSARRRPRPSTTAPGGSTPSSASAASASRRAWTTCARTRRGPATSSSATSPTAAPASASRVGNVYYESEEEFIYAWADALREEYKAIVDAGLILQLDDPCIAENWAQINPAPTG